MESKETPVFKGNGTGIAPAGQTTECIMTRVPAHFDSTIYHPASVFFLVSHINPNVIVLGQVFDVSLFTLWRRRAIGRLSISGMLNIKCNFGTAFYPLLDFSVRRSKLNNNLTKMLG
jgi:hypothetical protein